MRRDPIDDEFMQGYRDGRDPDEPEPGPNRSAAYRHSFEIARAEKQNRPIPAHVSRAKAGAIREDVA